jgi:hypothetical protein
MSIYEMEDWFPQISVADLLVIINTRALRTLSFSLYFLICCLARSSKTRLQLMSKLLVYQIL